MSLKRFLILLAMGIQLVAGSAVAANHTPSPLLEQGEPVDWWFVFKFNAAAFPGCGDGAARSCAFGGTVQEYQGKFGQQFVYASSKSPSFQKGNGCVGTTVNDPVGATFDQVYNGAYHYVIWNDQFYRDPRIKGCSDSCSAPWGHSKGMLAWNDQGEGFVMQVSTPSWPASGSRASPRTGGNTLGCVRNNNVLVSQHFFALQLNNNDLLKVLAALRNASVVTDPSNRQIVRNGGPPDVQAMVKRLGTKSKSTTRTRVRLSSGVDLISKPSGLSVPPWQMVSATLGGVPLRTATWWADPVIGTTTAATPIGCWQSDLGMPGPVEIATTGVWDGKVIGLKGGPHPSGNHAKIGVSRDTEHLYAIFGDLNQTGALSGTCKSSQNGRGGMFYVLTDRVLSDGVTNLIKGETAKVVGE